MPAAVLDPPRIRIDGTAQGLLALGVVPVGQQVVDRLQGLP
jgi:hypothetical protein